MSDTRTNYSIAATPEPTNQIQHQSQLLRLRLNPRQNQHEPTTSRLLGPNRLRLTPTPLLLPKNCTYTHTGAGRPHLRQRRRRRRRNAQHPKSALPLARKIILRRRIIPCPRRPPPPPKKRRFLVGRKILKPVEEVCRGWSRQAAPALSSEP